MQEAMLVLVPPAVEARDTSAHLSRLHYRRMFGITAEEFHNVSTFLQRHQVSIVNADKARRLINVLGTSESLTKAFGVPSANIHEGVCASLAVPRPLRDTVQAIFCASDRKLAMPYFEMPPPGNSRFSSRVARGHYPHEVAALYNFPKGVDGTGQTIALIELGGGYRQSDIERYFRLIDRPAPEVSFVRIGGVGNAPSVFASDDREVMLDILVAGSVAPAAKIVVYFAPNNNKGFYDAISKAVHDNKNKPDVISISWGAPEKKWDKRVMQSFNNLFKTAATLGISVCVASGDSGSNGGIHDGNVHVDFPSSSPWVLACGGTRMLAKEKKILSEVVWHEADNAAGGGGVSEVFPLPDYQAEANVPCSLNKTKFMGRGVPDVAGNAAHSTGYKIIVNGKNMVIGGTSAVAPLYAGLIALNNQKYGKNIGFVNPILYENAHLFRAIVKGNNVTARSKLGYAAAPGWNGCTGLGVHNEHWFG